MAGNDMRKLILPAIIISVGLFIRNQCSPISHPRGELVTTDPQQVNFTKSPADIKVGEWTMHPLASFTVEGRVLGVKGYSDDFPAEICPYDVALGWGPMSDTALLEKLDISQSSRFYRWQYWGELPVKEREVINHSANMHLIPSDDGIKKQIARLREGSLVRIIGQLVEVTNPKSTTAWKSSLRRDDSGAGACEIIYVKGMSVLE